MVYKCKHQLSSSKAQHERQRAEEKLKLQLQEEELQPVIGFKVNMLINLREKRNRAAVFIMMIWVSAMGFYLAFSDKLDGARLVGMVLIPLPWIILLLFCVYGKDEPTHVVPLPVDLEAAVGASAPNP